MKDFFPAQNLVQLMFHWAVRLGALDCFGDEGHCSQAVIKSLIYIGNCSFLPPISGVMSYWPLFIAGDDFADFVDSLGCFFPTQQLLAHFS